MEKHKMIFMTKEEKINWIIKQHQNTNHYYDEYLPYEFHLRMVVQVFNDFKHLLPKDMFLGRVFLSLDYTPHADRKETIFDITQSVIELACWGHDLIEDTRTSYNDCKVLELAEKRYVSEIIRACTNYGRGRDRSERMPDFVYEELKSTPGATFVKLCDRIANVQYSKMTKSSMFEKYKKENFDFLVKINADIYPEMRDYLTNLFKS